MRISKWIVISCFWFLIYANQGAPMEAGRVIAVPSPYSSLTWDDSRGSVYCTDPEHNAVVTLGLGEGDAKSQVTFTNEPSRMCLSPDGEELFVTLHAQPSSETWFDNQYGYVAIIDLNSFTLTRWLSVDIDPFDIAVLPSGAMIITSGSGQWTYAAAYDTTTGQNLGSVNGVVREDSQVVAHPDGRRIYIAGAGFLQRFDFDPASRTFSRRGPYFPAQVPDLGIWMAPGGGSIFTGNGQILGTDEVVTNEFVSVGKLENVFFYSLDFDVTHKAIFTTSSDATGARLQYFNLNSLLPAQSFILDRGADYVHANGTNLWISFVSSSNVRTIRQFTNPAVGAETNQAPVASFVTFPAPPTTLSSVRFDASGSTDDSDSTTKLSYRWDLNGDGVFDTPFTQSPLLTTNYPISGAVTITVQIHDRFGESSTATNTLNVLLAEDSGSPGPVIIPYRLPFEAAAVVFDPTRPVMYASDSHSNRLVVVDLKSGTVARQFTFFRPPESIAITPDGKWLYVALLDAPHDSYRRDLGSGVIAEFDLLRGVKTKEFAVTVDPGTLAVIDSRIVAVGGGSSQLTQLQTYNAVDGKLRATAQVRELSPLAILPSQTIILTSEADTMGSTVRSFSIDQVTGQLNAIGGQHIDQFNGGGMSVNDEGAYCADSSGNYFSLTNGIPADSSAHDLGGATPFSASGFEPSSRGMLLLAGQSRLWGYNLKSALPARSIPITNAPTHLHLINDQIVAVSIGGGQTSIQITGDPTAGSDSNQPPSLSVTYAPVSPTTRFPVVFNASQTIDENTPSNEILYQWDLDGDGASEIPWSSANSASQRFLTPGTHKVSVEARDTWGAVSHHDFTLNVVLEADPGEPGRTHTPWHIPFVAAGSVFDIPRKMVWLSDPTGHAVVQVSLDTGTILREWPVNYSPETLAMTHDGKHLFAAIPVHPHGYFQPGDFGYVAQFNLDPAELSQFRQVAVDPGDIAVMDRGYLFVAGGSGGYTSINSYTFNTGKLLASVPVYNGARLRVSPSQGAIFTATYYDINPYIMRLSFDPSSGRISTGVQTPPFGVEMAGVGGAVFVLPGEGSLLGGGAAVYLNSPGSPQDLHANSKLPLPQIVAETEIPGQGMFAAISQSSLAYFSNGTLATSGVYNLGSQAIGVGASSDNLYVLTVGVEETVLHRRTAPSTDPATNLPPTVRWVSPATDSVYVYPASVHLATEPDDSDGGIVSVTYMENGKTVSIATNFPYALDVVNLASGPHTIAAIAQDNLGATNQPVSIKFRLALRPTIQWVNLPDPFVVDAGTDVQLSAQAGDAGGVIREVRFYRDAVATTNLLATVTNAPFALVITNFSQTSLIVAQAINGDGFDAATQPALVQLAGAAGDDFYRSFVLTGSNVTTSQPNVLATSQLYEPGIPGSAPTHSLWWHWTPPVAGHYTVSTSGSTFDTLLAVYTGTNLAHLTLIGSNDDDPANTPTSALKFTAFPGTTYVFDVDGYKGASGIVNLSVSLDSKITIITPPVNDMFTNRIILTGIATNFATFNVGAGSERSEPLHDGSSAGASLWWEWTALTNGILRLSTAGSDFDTVLAAYTGSPSQLSTLQSVGSNDDDPAGGKTSRLMIHTISGVRYLIAVSGYAGATGSIQFSLDFTPDTGAPPVNDLFENRTVISGGRIFYEGSNLYATVQPNEPNLGFAPARATVWFKWTSPGTGQVYLRVQGGKFVPGAAVFQGSALTNLVRVAATTDPSRFGTLTFSAEAGKEYSIAIDAAFGGTGLFQLILDAPNLVSPPRLTLVPSQMGRGFGIDLGSSPGGTITVFRSTNLMDWDSILTNQVSPNQLLPLPDSGFPIEFYKIHVE